MSMRKRLLSPLVGLALVGVCAPSFAADEAAIPAKWKVQEIKYSYVGFTTAYDCESVEDKIKQILVTLGAHSGTQVQANGCPAGRPSRNFFVTITAATPIPVAEIKETKADKSRQDLLKRLGVKNELSDAEFPATWKTVELSKDRRLDLRPGDCELIEGLNDKVLPKLAVKVEAQRISCTPNQLSIQPPQLRVSALMPLKSPDAKGSDSSR